MALIQVNYVSNALKRTVPMRVILPVDKLTPEGKLYPKKNFKTLYLLHGFWGNCTDWVSGTRIQRWAEEKDLCVVMPSGDNSFYVDRPQTLNNYGVFIGEELVEITRRMFPLSRKKEDTFIGGLSMGGFGAVRNGLKYHDTFGAVISFSGVLQPFEALEKRPADYDTSFEVGTFGELKQAAASDNNPTQLVHALANSKLENPGVVFPNFYIACGTEDPLLRHSRGFRDLLTANGFDVTYEESPGNHNWDFWDTYIKKAIDWLPLEEAAQGINSGNVN